MQKSILWQICDHQRHAIWQSPPAIWSGGHTWTCLLRPHITHHHTNLLIVFLKGNAITNEKVPNNLSVLFPCPHSGDIYDELSSKAHGAQLHNSVLRSTITYNLPHHIKHSYTIVWSDLTNDTHCDRTKSSLRKYTSDYPSTMPMFSGNPYNLPELLYKALSISTLWWFINV